MVITRHNSIWIHVQIGIQILLDLAIQIPTNGASTLCILHISCFYVCELQVFVDSNSPSPSLSEYPRFAVVFVSLTTTEFHSLLYFFLHLRTLHSVPPPVKPAGPGLPLPKSVQNINDIYIGYSIIRQLTWTPPLIRANIWVIKINTKATANSAQTGQTIYTTG